MSTHWSYETEEVTRQRKDLPQFINIRPSGLLFKEMRETREHTQEVIIMHSKMMAVIKAEGKAKWNKLMG